MALLSVHDLSLTFGGELLLDKVELHLQEGERACLVGRNGTGKSTLMKIVAGEVLSDSGQVSLPSGVSVAYLGQEIPQSPKGTAVEVAAGEQELRSDSDPEGRRSAASSDPEAAAARRLEAERLLTRLGVPLEADLATASGGVIRRVLLARALSAGAGLLLLDEPTNHLDLEAVLWLEEYLLRLSTLERRTILFVTHDRAFARRLTNRVAELDRGRLYDYDCGFEEFQERREERLANEAAVQERFEQRLAEEEAWLRKGVKARRRRNEGRLRKLLAMRETQARRREQIGSARIALDNAARSGDLVVETENLRFGYGEEPIISDLTTMVMRGDRVGIVGPNGAGKSTLVKLLLGELKPWEGSVQLGTGLQIVYFDQMRSLLDPESSIYQNVGEGYDTVGSGNRQRHLIAYLQDFLFDREEVNKPIKALSGGERNRVLLAKLFAKPANLLVLDEPTNDLDADTLDLLEEHLLDFSGTIILVSHDRQFLDNVVTECLVLPGNGTVEEHVGSYSDWLSKKGQESRAEAPRKQEQTKKGKPKSARSSDSVKKLSFKEERELEALPERISDLEEELGAIHERLADPELYKGSLEGPGPGELTSRQEEVQRLLEEGYARWEELDGKAEG